MSKPKFVIIVAGGKGERMQSDIPKQFIEIHGTPILMWTMEAFYRYDASLSLIVVLPAIQISYWETLCQKHSFEIYHQIIAGGETRFYSVKNGLDIIEGDGLIAVHDGVRPLVSVDTISRCFDEAAKTNAAIPVVDLVDSIRVITAEGNQALDRSAYKLVQTPQVFDAALIRRAYQQNYTANFTDDASVVESIGAKIQLVEGNPSNIKITTGIDLLVAASMLKLEK